MAPNAARRLAEAVWVLTILLFVAGLVLTVMDHPTETSLAAVIGLGVAVYSTVGALVARRYPRNPIGWLLCAIAASLALAVFGHAWSRFGSPVVPEVGSLPWVGAAVWVKNLAPTVTVPVALPAFLLVFPDGRLASRRWRVAMFAAGVAGILLALGVAARIQSFDGSRAVKSPGWLSAIPAIDGFAGAGTVLAAAAALAGLASLVRRYRRATGDERHPLRLLLVMLAAMAGSVLTLPLGWVGALLMFFTNGFGILIGIPGATAAAILTYGLYDVGVVVRKTIVSSLLGVFFLLVLGVVGFFVLPLANGGGSQTASSRVAGALVTFALLAAALWRPAKHVANRLVFGRRATPYEAVSTLADRLGDAYALEDVLPRMADVLRAAIGADLVRIWLRLGEELRPVASAPMRDEHALRVHAAADELPPVLDGDPAFAIRDHGELLGAVSVRPSASEPLRASGQKLVSDLCAQAGLVLRNVRLTEELKWTIEELRASRQRIVAAQDEERRRIERNIHDGAQQQLVALAVKLRLADALVGKDDERARSILAQLQDDAKTALEDLRDLARGIYPPLLADQGLAAAIPAQARKSPLPVTVDCDGLGRFAPEVEAAVYFCTLEALQNVAKYAQASNVTVSLGAVDGHLTFSVADDGVGFSPEQAQGSGLVNMRDRLESLGGSLEVRSAPGAGTTLAGSIPVVEGR